MKLTTFTDYAFRVLIYLDSTGEPASLNELAQAYGISRNHLVKAVNTLEKSGFVKTKRGVGGGISLARPAAEIRLADVALSTEPNFTIVECFDYENNTCRIAGACRLERILQDATRAFMAELQKYTLADVTGNRKVLLKLIARSAG
jgi:Rrf2 family nitric oxide-sensitive transcriptional repressor